MSNPLYGNDTLRSVGTSTAVVVTAVDASGAVSGPAAAQSYQLNDYTDSTAPNYYGFERSDGAWFIKKLDDSSSPVSVRYAAGSSAYATAWTNRASQSYDTYGNTF